MTEFIGDFETRMHIYSKLTVACIINLNVVA